MTSWNCRRPALPRSGEQRRPYIAEVLAMSIEAVRHDDSEAADIRYLLDYVSRLLYCEHQDRGCCLHGSANGTRTRISALRGPRANLCTIAPRLNIIVYSTFQQSWLTLAGENGPLRRSLDGRIHSTARRTRRVHSK